MCTDMKLQSLISLESGDLSTAVRTCDQLLVDKCVKYQNNVARVIEAG